MAYISLFTNSEYEDLSKLPPDEQKREAVALCKQWFDIDRLAKQPYMEEMDEMYKLYNGDHWNLLSPSGKPLRDNIQQETRPNVVENYTFALIEGLVSEFANEIELTDFPREKGDEEVANLYTNLKKFIAYKNSHKKEQLKFLRNFFLYGTGIWHVYWDSMWYGGKGPNRWLGDIRWQALHPKALFVDARCKEDINDAQRVHKAVYRPIEYIFEKYPEAKKELQSDIVRDDMLIGFENEDFYSSRDQVLVVETWYKGEPLIIDKDEENKGYGLHVIWWAGDTNPVYLGHANYIYFDPEEDSEPKYPFIIAQCYPRENSIWGYGEAYFLKNPQIILNKTAEIILEGHIHQALGQTVYNESALTPKQRVFIEKYGNLAGMWFPVKDINGIKKIFPGGIPASLQNEVIRLQKTMESIIGRFDISQGKTPGSVTAFRALSLLASRAQVRLRIKEMAIMNSYEEAGKYINHLVNKFYTEKRMFRIVGEDKNIQYHVFNPEKVKKVYDFVTNESKPLENYDTTNRVEGVDYEIYSPEFDVVCRVTTTAPSDRIFYMDMAKELFAARLIGEKEFWYVMEYGKFPPYEKLMSKVQERMKETEQQQAEQGQAIQNPLDIIGQLQALQQNQVNANVSDEEIINQILAQDPELNEKFQSLSDEEKAEIINQVLQQQRG